MSLLFIGMQNLVLSVVVKVYNRVLIKTVEEQHGFRRGRGFMDQCLL